MCLAFAWHFFWADLVAFGFGQKCALFIAMCSHVVAAVISSFIFF